MRFSNPSLINTIICETGGYNTCQTKANGKVIFHHATAQPILVNIIPYTIYKKSKIKRDESLIFILHTVLSNK